LINRDSGAGDMIEKTIKINAIARQRELFAHRGA
jgi:hypothetical protein